MCAGTLVNDGRKDGKILQNKNLVNLDSFPYYKEYLSYIIDCLKHALYLLEL
jgi:hypothetical protein